MGNVKPIVFLSNKAIRELTEARQAEVERKKVNFPKELGEEHPFDFKKTEQAYQEIGLINASVEKHKDFIISPGFYVKSDVKKAETLITDFNRDIGMDIVIRNILTEWLVKGNAFVEIAINKNNINLQIVS